MKTKAIVTLLLLAICTAIYASEDINDPELYWRKTQEMNQMVERFKEDTGFEGQISYGYKRMRLGSFEGNFSDIPFTADADTTAFRQACERIVEKILPYSPANRMQLSMCRISKRWGSFTTDYKQQVGGYQVEGSGFIMITYDAGRKHFSIGDNTVELPDGDVSVIITPEEAESIALSDFNNENYASAVVLRLSYSKEGSEQYYLSYSITVSSDDDAQHKSYQYWIDAKSGEIKEVRPTRFLEQEVSVRVKGKMFETVYDLNNEPHTGVIVPIEDARVYNDNQYDQTNNNGYVFLPTMQLTNARIQLKNHRLWMTVHPTISILEEDIGAENQTSPNQYDITFSDVTDTRSHYAPNSFMASVSHVNSLSLIHPEYFHASDSLRIITGYPHPEMLLGNYDFQNRIIRLKDARFHETVKHELSHHFVYSIVGSFMAGSDTNMAAMDEGLAIYFCGSASNNSIIPQYGQAVDFSHHCIVPNLSLGEDSYAVYDCGVPIASAWWSLRSHSELQNPLSVNNVVDTLLVGALGIVKRELDDNATYRYKPRYFYNILMKRVDDDTTPYPLNPKQVAIQKAYTSRGFNFYPRVQSYSLAQKPRNCFSAGNQVHVNITEAPQNTPFKVYVIRHGDYTYINGASVSTLNDHLASEFTPIEEGTDADGRWSGPIWTIPTITENAIGEYDIIVDFGSPERPDGNIHFAFNAADVMDGFDGLNGPGFTVYDDGIDVATSSVKSSYQRMLID